MASEEIQEMAETIHLSAKRLDYLIQNFLLYAEIEILAADPEKIKALKSTYTEFSIAIITEVLKKEAKQVEREADLLIELKDVPVQISETDLNKIVEEVIENAFKYSPAGTPVRVINHLAKNKFILEITNKGRGMTSEQIANLGAYMQFDRKVYAQEGSGLGLIIAKRLAELHGGELKIDSIPDQETTVRVILPMS
jgi:signal transduction histidine kinase